MARRPRIVIPGQPLHIVQRGNNRQAVFFTESDYATYLECLRDAAYQQGCAVHAYVLMTNHVHLLLTPVQETSLSKCIQAVGRKYVRYINGHYRRSGTLWEGRFKSAMVDSTRYLFACYRYIELNPVRANMVGHPLHYRWSSFHANATGQQHDVITPHPLYLQLGKDTPSRCEAYQALFDCPLTTDEVDTIRVNTQTDSVIGNERFKHEIAQALQRGVEKYSHGGDRKTKEFKRQKDQVY